MRNNIYICVYVILVDETTLLKCEWSAPGNLIWRRRRFNREKKIHVSGVNWILVVVRRPKLVTTRSTKRFHHPSFLSFLFRWWIGFDIEPVNNIFCTSFQCKIIMVWVLELESKPSACGSARPGIQTLETQQSNRKRRSSSSLNAFKNCSSWPRRG